MPLPPGVHYQAPPSDEWSTPLDPRYGDCEGDMPPVIADRAWWERLAFFTAQPVLLQEYVLGQAKLAQLDRYWF